MSDFVGLPEDQLLFVQQCKEETISDGELIESSCDEENEDKILYPSECVVEECKQRKEKMVESTDQLKEGNITLPVQ